MLVDDEAIILSVLSLHVRSFLTQGIEVIVANSGEDAIRLFEEVVKPTGELVCIVSDYMMYPMNGGELLGHFEHLAPNSKKIMLTGQTDITAVAEVLEKTRLFRYIEKPWDPKDLELTLSDAVEMYFNETALQRRTEELEILHKELEKKVEERTAELNQKNEELRQGLEYARFVQQCFLPNNNEAWGFLPEFHVYSSSSEAVSGDFFWFKHEGEEVLLALGDCTGHGLAGALLTVLVSDLLEDKTSKTAGHVEVQQVVEEALTDLLKRLNRDIQYSDVAAGFDMVLLKINKETGDIDWASLNSNLMLINEKNDVEVVAKSKGFLFLKGAEPEVFSGKLNAKGKRIAMCSDGLYDQIGEKSNRRLRLSGLVDMIQGGEVFHSYQCHIDELFVKWKGAQDQTDDATWVSFKL